MERGVRRWLVDISVWNPSKDRFDSLVSLLPMHERSAITRFLKFEDRKRALVSRLLQYSLVHEVLGIPFDKIIINRTVEGKPYLESGEEKEVFPNFNFNVSHHGDYVGIASEPVCLVGLDIVSKAIPLQETILEFIKNFSPFFTASEWKNIINAGSLDETLVEFYRYWCLKEAYVKAQGAGLGYGLNRLEFHHTNWADVTVHIDGVLSKDWRFQIFQLGKGHWAAVARGHPEASVHCFEKEDYWDKGFVVRTVEHLIPVLLRQKPQILDDCSCVII